MALTLSASAYSPQIAYTMLHKLLLQTKLSHYLNQSFAQHEAFGRTYDSLNDLIDTITEKLIGYSSVDPQSLAIGTVSPLEPAPLGTLIMSEALKLEKFAESKGYCDIENLAQELSGVGAQLKYLARFK
jgi:hypothetical protein